MSVRIERVAASETISLRQRVLRPHQTVDQLRWPGDDDQHTAHFAAIEQGEIIGTGSVQREPPSWAPEATGAWRLRGMATAEDHRNRGVGRAILAAVIQYVRERRGGLLWCNARVPTVAFYERGGFTTRGDPWNDPEIGPHIAMELLVAGSDGQDVLREQRDYYAARASEYDESYQRIGQYDRGPDTNAQWQAEMARVIGAFAEVPIGGDVLELAAGTGFWTEHLVSRARTLHVIDSSAETLAVNRSRLGRAAERVSYEVADLFEWHPPRTWDTCMFGFWICKVPDDRIAGFLNTVAAALRPGGVVCFIEKSAPSDPATEQIERTLNDGRRFTIIDHPRPPRLLVDLFAAAGLRIEVETVGDRLCLGHGTRG